MRRHRQLKIGWFDQHSNESLNGEQTPVEYLSTKFQISHQVCFIFICLKFKIFKLI